ncbi:MAG: hypothetical protein AAGA91_17455 [Pseudomonadota bacterium]
MTLNDRALADINGLASLFALGFATNSAEVFERVEFLTPQLVLSGEVTEVSLPHSLALVCFGLAILLGRHLAR